MADRKKLKSANGLYPVSYTHLEDDENFLNAVAYMFKGLEKRKPDCFAVKQYRKYK